MFGELPKMMVQPVETNDHPEVDTSELLDNAGIKHYQCLIGELQWAVSLGRYDILQAVMSMSRFRTAPLYYCLVTGRACTGILHFVNQTPIEWFSKRQFCGNCYLWK